VSANLDDPYLRPNSPLDTLRNIGRQAGIPDDVVEDYSKVTRVESGHNPLAGTSPRGAKGFGQLTPDKPGLSYKTVGGRRYDITDPVQNMEGGLRYFHEGGTDPVARRLYYFGGPGARQHYQRTGKIPNISDGNMTAAQYVRATGGAPRTFKVGAPPKQEATPAAPGPAASDPYLQPNEPEQDDPYLVPNTPAAPKPVGPVALGVQPDVKLGKPPLAGVQAGVKLGQPAARTKFAYPYAGPRRIQPQPTVVTAPGGAEATEPGLPGLPRITPTTGLPTMSSVLAERQERTPEQQARISQRANIRQQVESEPLLLNS
jgi:hypothetical protein